MRTEYRLWRKSTERESYREQDRFETRELAAAATDQPDLDRWNVGGDPENRWVDTQGGYWLLHPELVPESDTDRITLALDLALGGGGIDGAHHKQWSLDQIVRVLTGDQYDTVIAEYQDGEDGPDTYTWDEGVAP